MANSADEIVFAEVVDQGGIERKYLRIQDLRRLQHVEFTTRRPIEGRYSGKHASPQRGQSVEFRDYREYIPGDDIGTVDWKVYGRSDRLFIKRFEHQTDLTVHLLVDASASMRYAGRLDRGKSKYDQACFLAAAIGFLICKQADRVSLSMSQEGRKEHLRPGSSMRHLAAILQTMETVKPRGKAKLAATIRDVIGKGKRRDLLIVFSDLLEDRDEIIKAISTSLHRGGEVIMFHVLHPEEIDLPRIDNGLFVDSETAARIRLNVNDIRPHYEQKIKAFLDGWSAACKGRGIDYNLVKTSDEYHKSLEKYLFRRATTR